MPCSTSMSVRVQWVGGQFWGVTVGGKRGGLNNMERKPGGTNRGTAQYNYVGQRQHVSTLSSGLSESLSLWDYCLIGSFGSHGWNIVTALVDRFFVTAGYMGEAWYAG